MAVDLTDNFDGAKRPGNALERPLASPGQPRSAGGQRGVGGEDEAEADGAGLQRVLGLRAARVERLKPAELDLVRLSQPTFAERPLRTPADRPARTATEVARMVEFDVLGLA